MSLTVTKIKKMCNQAVDNYSAALKYVPEYVKTLKMCNEVDDTHFGAMQFVLNNLKLKKCVIKLLLFLLFIWFSSWLI